ncbi:hypothetical protein GPECTOR_15g387 [Gonium pectorale]|uniref:SEC-C motif-containing protein n=1 Tax=Gonium pectorale TaxID=33097 RepID=A0A150GLJ6_GONPE|nr:hypothetical protein GPECTOR_15g387 [Gonium pectorale]|eukprot:KXZ50703.1 hypothetical protein GPECTOR_15g387 [Gonium pectorale]
MGKRTSKAEDAPRVCPCGSGLKFSECCSPIVSGAWARTAPELARARFAALQLGKPQVLADTTHPEALAAIGTKQSLLKKAEQLMRRRGAGQLDPVLADCVHGQSPEDPDIWFVLLAISVGEPGAERIYTFAEKYRKDGGRWWYISSPWEFPVLPQFEEFLERHHGSSEENPYGPLYGQYEYGWLALPPRRLSPAAASHRPQWLVDDWPEGQKDDWVYLDTAVDPETGLTAAQVAARLSQAMTAASLRDPKIDWESYYFRQGRFME